MNLTQIQWKDLFPSTEGDLDLTWSHWFCPGVALHLGKVVALLQLAVIKVWVWALVPVLPKMQRGGHAGTACGLYGRTVIQTCTVVRVGQHSRGIGRTVVWYINCIKWMKKLHVYNFSDYKETNTVNRAILSHLLILYTGKFSTVYFCLLID